MDHLHRFEFSPAQWSEVVSAIPKSQQLDKNLKVAKLRLEGVANGYFKMERDRKIVAASSSDWVEIQKLISKAIHRAKKAGLDGDDDFVLRPLNEALAETKRHTFVHDFANRDRLGRSDPSREMLYRDVLNVWMQILGGELRRSGQKGAKWEPDGPTIRFLSAVLNAILEKPPGKAGLDSIIERFKKAPFFR